MIPNRMPFRFALASGNAFLPSSNFERLVFKPKLSFVTSLFLFLFIVLVGNAQKDSTSVAYDTLPLEVLHIEDVDLQKYRDDEAFDYEVVTAERTWWDDFKTWVWNIFRRIFEAIFGVEKATGFLSVFLRIVPYLLLGILLYLLIQFFGHVNANRITQAKKHQATVGLSEEENLIKNEDLQQLVQKALADQNYRLAVRYYYLYLLQLMTDRKIIVWELQKTNDDYLMEIENPDLKPPFRAITRLYDHIWYGDFHIDADKYERAEKTFLSLQKKLKGNA